MKGSRKKMSIFFSGPATKRGWGKGLATETKDRFLKLNKNSEIFVVATKLERGDSLSGRTTKKKTDFLAASLSKGEKFYVTIKPDIRHKGLPDNRCPEIRKNLP